MIWYIIFSLEIFILVLLLSFSLSIFFGAPYYPSSKERIRQMIKAANLKKGDKILELGSGDGRILIEIAKEGYNVVGVELNIFVYILSRFKVFFSPYRSKIKIVFGNFWYFDTSQFNIVFCYLFPFTMDKLYSKLNREMISGSKLISNTFIVRNTNHRKEGRVFVYEIKK